MKKLLLIALLATGMVANAQKANDGLPHTENFTIVADDIVWQKTYPTKLSFKDVSTNVKMAGIFFEKPDVDEPVITGNLKPITTHPKALGYKWGNTNTLINNNNIGGFMALKYNADSVTVQVKKMYLTPTSGTKGENFSEWFVNKGNFHKVIFVGQVAQIIDNDLNNLFEPLFK